MSSLRKSGSVKRILSWKQKRTSPGSAPGIIVPSEDALAPQLRVTTYDSTFIQEYSMPDLQAVVTHIEKHPEKITWVELRGFADRALLEQFCGSFGIHRLEMEDVISIHQRAKLEDYDDHLFIVTRMLRKNGDESLRNEQVSLFLKKNLVITFQHSYEDYFEPVRIRLRTGKGHLRSSYADYLAYALLDSAVDFYFPLLEKYGEQLDVLEDELLGRPSHNSLHKIQSLKRELILLRRAMFAERDKVNDILRTNNDFISDQTRIYLRDTYDHTIQAMDLVESYKEIIASLMEIYLSSVSFRLNQVMKVLAIISTIFIPLTFIVGVYGMNFSTVDPVTGAQLPLNMPELYSPYGYTGVMLFMLALVIVQLLIFWRKGWLDKS